MTGIELIAEERRQQIEKHGFDEANDDQYFQGELVGAAECILGENTSVFPETWHPGWMKKFLGKPRVEQLAIAGALIAAEIDRLQRAS